MDKKELKRKAKEVALAEWIKARDSADAKYVKSTAIARAEYKKAILKIRRM